MIPLTGYRLDECSYSETRVGSIMDCAHLCVRENGQCRSINIEKSTTSNGGYKCQLNNSTKENHFHKFLKNSAYSYFEPKNVRIYFVFFQCIINQHIYNEKYFAIPGLGEWQTSFH